MTKIHTARVDFENSAENFWDAFRRNLTLLTQSSELCLRCNELLADDVTTFKTELDYQSFRAYVSGFVGFDSGPAHANFPIVFNELDDEQPSDSCMTRIEADSLLETWNSQKPQLFVLLMRENNEWSETAYGEPCISSDEDDMQGAVNQLCKNCRDFRDAKFGYSDYPFESPYIIERLFDENTYDDE